MALETNGTVREVRPDARHAVRHECPHEPVSYTHLYVYKRQDQVRAVQIEILVDQEILLLRPQRDGHAFIRKPEALHQPLDGVAQCLPGAEQRGFLVQRVSRIGTIGGGNAEGGSCLLYTSRCV